MSTMIADARSGVANDNIQEIIDAGTSAGGSMFQGQNQYQTPRWLARALGGLLPASFYNNVIDPQGAGGALVKEIDAEHRYVCDIDNRFREQDDKGIYRAKGNCVRFDEIATEIFHDAFKFECIVANPPFGLRWKFGESSIDSTQWTWQFITDRLMLHGAGFLISNIDTLRKLGITTHPWVYLVQEFPAGGVWDNCNVKLGIVHFQHTVGNRRIEKVWPYVPSGDEIIRAFSGRHFANTYSYGRDMQASWNVVCQALREENSNRPQYNIYLNRRGILQTYLSTIAKHKFKRSDIVLLSRINDCHPLTLTTEKETRLLLRSFLESKIYTMEPAARDAIEAALDAVKKQACPITPVTDFELVAYTEEEETLTARAVHPLIKLTPGKKYPLNTGTYSFREHFTRKKLHYKADGSTHLEDHDCELTGQDRFIEIQDDCGTWHRFMDRPPAGNPNWHSETLIWQVFEKPVVKTVAEAFTELYQINLKKLKMHAMCSGFSYFDGQLDYYARVGCKPYALVGADVGTGKTLGALSLVIMRSPKRTLIVAPQGTMRSSGEEGEVDYQASQWVQEIQRFAPGEPVFQLFSKDDYYAILRANGGEFPAGIYVTYPQAYWQNDAFEFLPRSWETGGEVKFRRRFDLPIPEEGDVPASDYVSKGVGQSMHGIRCIATPSLATVIASEQDEWDAVIIDEAHLMCNLDANITKNLLRLQPKLRYAMTATPIPNFVYNVFSLLGWLCVDNWHFDDIRNTAWPYALGEIGRFKTTFMSTETDKTEQLRAKLSGDKAWKRRGIRQSPIISSPARLLKLLKPNMAYISKEQCNPNLMPCEVIDVRVPMGNDQSKLYAHWLDRNNYKAEFANPMTIALVQMSRLRGVTAAPLQLDYNINKLCRSDFNPKTIAMLELIRDCLKRGEQCVVVSARVDQSDVIAQRLSDAGIPISRIDSTVPSEYHTAESNRFKRGDSRVHLMGIKCAQGYSFDQCPNLIIGSLEWSYGSLHQAKGRVWRLTSKRPVKVWCVLVKNSIEELLFDRVATKQDAATICLHGQRVPRDFMPMDASEVLAEHIVDYQEGDTIIEFDVESSWPELRRQLKAA